MTYNKNHNGGIFVATTNTGENIRNLCNQSMGSNVGYEYTFSIVVAAGIWFHFYSNKGFEYAYAPLYA
jgi:hypothetical protein